MAKIYDILHCYIVNLIGDVVDKINSCETQNNVKEFILKRLASPRLGVDYDSVIWVSLCCNLDNVLSPMALDSSQITHIGIADNIEFFSKRYISLTNNIHGKTNPFWISKILSNKQKLYISEVIDVELNHDKSIANKALQELFYLFDKNECRTGIIKIHTDETHKKLQASCFYREI